MGRLCFSTYVVDMKECDALESNNTTIEVSLIKNKPMTTFGASWTYSTAIWLTLPQAQFCLAAIGIEMAPLVGAHVAVAI
jgi:hypothetical protein